MKKQAQRAYLLTILAVIYLPLTLVTGIFGMNLKEINDGVPRFWACILGLVFVGGGTVAGIFRISVLAAWS
jgi:Mg2+ and Co2+ transporter CorA